MRVLHFYKTSFPDSRGGVEQAINQIARGTSKLGVDTSVLSLTTESGGSRTVEVDGYQAHRTRVDVQIASTDFSLSALLRFSQLAKKADIVHYHFPWPFMDMVHFATRPKVPSVVTYHSDIIRQKQLLRLYRPLKRKFLSSVDRIVATSPNYFATSEVLQDFAAKVDVIPLGLDKSTYPHPSPERLRFWSETMGTKFFLFVGVLRYYKGLHTLIEAAHGTEYPVAIVGTGPIEEELKSQAARLGARNIHFLGHLPEEDKAALLTLCRGFTFPSHLRSEAFGISLLESAMYGKPMISAEIGTGTTFINIDGETGVVVPPNDPPALRRAMHYLWEHPAEAAEMGKRAEERYWKYFTAEKMVQSYMCLYDRLIKQQRSNVGR